MVTWNFYLKFLKVQTSTTYFKLTFKSESFEVVNVNSLPLEYRNLNFIQKVFKNSRFQLFITKFYFNVIEKLFCQA